MALFDSVVSEIKEHARLGEQQASRLLAALLEIIADPRGGGFAGFIDRFRNAGLGEFVNSWVTTGENKLITGDQVESALGRDTIGSISDRSSVDRQKVAGILGNLIPTLVDTLTPNGNLPDEKTLLTRVGGFLSEWGGAIGGTVAGGFAATSGGMRSEGDMVPNTAASLGNRVSRRVWRSDSDPGTSILSWLLPLLVLIGLTVLCYWFFSQSTVPNTVPMNANRTNANSNRTAVNANTNVANTNANTRNTN